MSRPVAGPIAPNPKGPTRKGWWIALAAAVVVLLAGALAVAVVVDRGDDHRDDRRASPTTPTDGTPADSLTVEVAGPEGASVFVSIYLDGDRNHSWSGTIPLSRTVTPAAKEYQLTVISTETGGTGLTTTVKHGRNPIARYSGNFNMTSGKVH